MLTVALIGPDGSGKTSIADRLLESPPCAIKYLYMGLSIESSNVALPTSRLVHRLKVHQHRRALRSAGNAVPDKVTLHGAQHRIDRRGSIGAVARLLSRLAEMTYRHLISGAYQLHGHVVLYDRHFLFDVCSPPSVAHQRRLTDRIQDWFLQRVFPKPGLVIFLDAPPDVLYGRKQEIPMEDLQKDRAGLLEKSVYVNHFVRVDATQPLDDVVSAVKDIIVQRQALDKAKRQDGKPVPVNEFDEGRFRA